MDNRILNINGPLHDPITASDLEKLTQALRFAFIQNSYRQLSDIRVTHYTKTKKSGLILLWGNNGNCKELPCPLDFAGVVQLILNYLQSEEISSVECKGWDRDADHDGDNGKGWRIFVEDWGHVEGNSCVICAIKPCFIWYGK